MMNYIYLWYRPDGAKTPAEIADVFVGLVFDGISTRGARAKPRRSRK